MKKIKYIMYGLLIVTAVLVFSGVGDKALQLVSKKAGATSTQSATKSITLPTAVADMNQAIATADSGVEVSTTLVDLDNDQTYNAGESGTVFKAASTAKLVAAVDYLHQVEQGQATLSQSIDGTSAEQLLKQMIEVSDNTAWADINDYMGQDQQESYAKSIGLTSFTGGDYNTITSADEAELLAQLYQGKLLTTGHRALLYNYMSHTDSTDLIQAALPATATVYHKYGELWGNLHDAAIVQYQGHNFVLVIYTKNDDNTVDDYSDRVTLIHAITDAAFKDIVAS